ncbi:MAG: arsenite methyltransferase [Dehalococcoidales bacterium]|nr:arsenite methyltransferase [Dehalococcoidales bacterium]
MEQNAREIKNLVKKRYGRIAKQESGSCCTCAPEAAASSSCCGTGATSCQPQTYAERLYTSEELEKLPRDVVDGSLGCGNPTAIAELKPGEVVLDLGSGGGLDCFLAAQKVGARGRVIGLDMTPEMIQLARKHAQKMGVGNVEFRLGEMEHMPVKDDSIDVIISNCVINLSPDKDAVFGEAYRVLKPGGRLCVSDVALVGRLPREIKEDLDQWVGCIAGALNEKTYLNKIRAAGFVNLMVERSVIPFYAGSEASAATKSEEKQSCLDLKNRVVSVRVKAFKPG